MMPALRAAVFATGHARLRYPDLSAGSISAGSHTSSQINATATAASGGSGSYTYQWQGDGSNIAGATSLTLAWTGRAASTAYSVRLVATDAVTGVQVTYAAVSMTTDAAPGAGDEPIYSAAAGHTSGFYDDFESYSTAANMLTSGGGPYIGIGSASQREIRTTGAFEGTRSFRVNYGTGLQEDVGVEDLGNSVTRAIPYILTMQIKTQAGYVWTNASGNTHKIMLFNTGIYTNAEGNVTSDSPGAGLFNCRMTLNFGEEPLDPPMPAYGTLGDLRPNVSWQVNSYQFPANLDAYGTGEGEIHLNDLTDGAWHRLTMRLTPANTLNAAGSTGDGRMEMWLDGIKVMEYLGDDNTRPEYGLCPVPRCNPILVMQYPTVKNAQTSAQWIEFDAVRVWTES